MDILTEAFHSILITEVLVFLSFLAFLVVTGLFLKELGGTQPPWGKIVLILGIALGLRVGWIYFTQPQPLSDFQVYWHYANAFYQGDLTFTELARHPGSILLFTLAFSCFGPSLWAVWGLNLLLTAIFLLFLFGITRDLFGSRAGLWAMALAGFFPQAIAYTGLAATEVPTIAYSVAILWAFLYSRNHHASKRWGYWVLLAFLLYGAAMIRMTLLLYLLVLPLVFWMCRREQFALWMQRFGVMLVTLGLLLSTWVVHQQLVSNGKTFFMGNTAWLTNVVAYQSGGRYVAQPQLSFPEIMPYFNSHDPAMNMKGYELLEAKSVDIIRQDPLKYLQYGFVRIYHILRTAQTGIRWTQKGSVALQAVPEKWVKKLCSVSNFYWQFLMGFGLLGLLAFRYKQEEHPREILWLISSFLVAWLGFHYLFSVASERYAFQIMPDVVILACGGLSSLVLAWGPKNKVSGRSFKVSSGVPDSV